MAQTEIGKDRLLRELEGWSRFLEERVRLIACGGTALTLLDLKESTKDVDLLIPDPEEFRILSALLEDLGYEHAGGVRWSRGGFVFDLFQDNRVHTTQLLESPLQESNHEPVAQFGRLSLGVLNSYDLIISKVFRGDRVDYEDVIVLLRERSLDLGRLARRYQGTAEYDVNPERMRENLKGLVVHMEDEGLDVAGLGEVIELWQP